MSTAPESPPPTPPSSSPASKLPLIAGGVAAVAAVVGIAVFALRDKDGTEPSTTTTLGPTLSADGRQIIPAYDKKLPLMLDEKEAPAVWADVTSAPKLRSLVAENAWLKGVTSSPLGEGFLGSWGAFLGSATDDLGVGAVGKGLLGDVVAEHLFGQPLRIEWLSSVQSTPVIVVPKPSTTLTTTIATLTTTLQRGGWLLENCPGEAPFADEAAKLPIVRWIVADHTLYVATARDRVAISRDHYAVAQALCQPLPSIEANDGTDVVVHAAPAQLGRDAQSLSATLGIGESVGAGFVIDGTRLVPTGLVGTLAHPERLASTAIAKDTFKLVPEDMPVVVGATLNLPATLTTEALAAAWSKDSGALKKRDVLVLWQPHGGEQATEVAVVWSDVADRAGLEAIFSGPNGMTTTQACGRLVVSSSPGLTQRIENACSGASPNITFAKPAVVSGLSSPWSLGAIVDLGRLTQTLLIEGHAHDLQRNGQAAPKAVPAEIETARTQLGELPRIGVGASHDNATLKGWGFSS